MTSTVEQRLESWREVVRTGKPYWLADLAPRIVRQLEDELRAIDASNTVMEGEEG